MEQLRRVKQELLQKETQRVEEQTELKAKLKYLEDPNYQKHLIHQELGYVEENEVMIQFPSKK